MWNWQAEIDQIVNEQNIRDLSTLLITWMKDVPVPEQDARTALDTILKNIATKLPSHAAVWVAFYLGAAWYKGLTND